MEERSQVISRFYMAAESTVSHPLLSFPGSIFSPLISSSLSPFLLVTDRRCSSKRLLCDPFHMGFIRGFSTLDSLKLTPTQALTYTSEFLHCLKSDWLFPPREKILWSCYIVLARCPCLITISKFCLKVLDWDFSKLHFSVLLEGDTPLDGVNNGTRAPEEMEEPNTFQTT